MSVVTIGNFDGVHLGHQALIQKLLERAKSLKTKGIVILFEPHPKEFFLKNEAPYRIQKLSDKLIKLKALGVEHFCILSFNEHLANLSPQAFIQEILQKKLVATELIGGEDFRFGKDRAGSLDNLKNAGIASIVVSSVTVEGERASSSKIRKLLLASDFKSAARLLGEPYSVSGRVIHGAKHGRLLGFSTLNIALVKKMPLSGVYAVKVHGLGTEPKTGVANVGRRPTVNPLAHPLLEVHVLDFNEEVYGKRVRIEFIRKIRAEKKFESLDALKAQIALDVAAVKQ